MPVPSDSPTLAPPAIAFLGTLRSDFILLPDGSFHRNLFGGAIAYAAAGAQVWPHPQLGLAAKVSRNFPATWLDACRRLGWDMSGILPLPAQTSFACFHMFKYGEWRTDGDPLTALAPYGISPPRDLEGYRDPGKPEGDLASASEGMLRPADLPRALREASAAYLGPSHLRSQLELSHALREAGVRNLILSPGQYALSGFRSQEIQTLLHGVQMVFLEERSLRRLWKETEADVTVLMDRLIRFGAQVVIVQRGNDGMLVADRAAAKTTYYPFYPTLNRNPIGVGASFCGGFLNAWIHTFDLQESVLRGCISASLTAEGFGALYATECNPRLAETRLFSLRRNLNLS